jgi:hypothetical protein
MTFTGSQFERELMLWAACCTIAGIDVMPAIRKGQLMVTGNTPHTLEEQCYSLAAQITISD